MLGPADLLRQAHGKKKGDHESEFHHPKTGEIVSKVTRADFINKSLVGRGFFGNVYKASYDGLNVAIKEVHGLDINKGPCGSIQMQAFEREMAFLRKTDEWKNENIVKFFGFLRFGREAWLILKLMDYDLKKVIRKGSYQNSSLVLHKPYQVLDNLGYLFLYQISNALKNIHEPDSQGKIMMHRDIKPTNIMVDRGRNQLALIDFNSTKQIVCNQRGQNTETPGAQKYQAPECFPNPDLPEFDHLESPEYDHQCDIWSLGITFVYFATGEHPIFPDNSEESSKSRDTTVEERVTGREISGKDIPDPHHIGLPIHSFSPEFQDFFKRFFNRRKPNERPSASEIFDWAEQGLKQLNGMQKDALFDAFITAESSLT